MARKRMIDPSIWSDESFGSLSSGAKILFIGLFSNADDEGRILANPAYLKATVFMYDTVTLDIIKTKRTEVIEKMSSVILYEVDGKEYIQLSRWEEYQKQQKDRIQPSKLPMLADAKQMLSKRVASAKQVLTQYSISKDKISKDKREEDRLRKETKVANATASLSYLLTIPVEDVADMVKTTGATERQVREKGQALYDYCESKGKQYKNYKALLRATLRKDYGNPKPKTMAEIAHIEVPTTEELERAARMRAQLNGLAKSKEMK